MPINAKWHAAHRMPPRATLAQRLRWHVAHAKHCGCRAMPLSVQRELARIASRRAKDRNQTGE